jgi:2-polyprenyl-3-methyl-5-hydroxy-6-metoxy-1,4-benzoquinol methylase
MTENRRAHWERVYAGKSPNDHSWFQEEPRTSLSLIRQTTLPPDAKFLDVGGGASSLPRFLLREGFRNVSFLDVSPGAIEIAKGQLGRQATDVEWIVSDILDFQPQSRWDLWHDRAVFHFLTSSEDRDAYCSALNRGLRPGGHLIMATFSLDGPSKCSGLDCVQYDPHSLNSVLGPQFLLRGSVEETHRTPSGGKQNFVYSWFQKDPDFDARISQAGGE